MSKFSVLLRQLWLGVDERLREDKLAAKLDMKSPGRFSPGIKIDGDVEHRELELARKEARSIPVGRRPPSSRSRPIKKTESWGLRVDRAGI